MVGWSAIPALQSNKFLMFVCKYVSLRQPDNCVLVVLRNLDGKSNLCYILVVIFTDGYFFLEFRWKV